MWHASCQTDACDNTHPSTNQSASRRSMHVRTTTRSQQKKWTWQPSVSWRHERNMQVQRYWKEVKISCKLLFSIKPAVTYMCSSRSYLSFTLLTTRDKPARCQYGTFATQLHTSNTMQDHRPTRAAERWKNLPGHHHSPHPLLLETDHMKANSWKQILTHKLRHPTTYLVTAARGACNGFGHDDIVVSFVVSASISSVRAQSCNPLAAVILSNSAAITTQSENKM